MRYVMKIDFHYKKTVYLTKLVRISNSFDRREIIL
jgi:hypothetical protein